MSHGTTQAHWFFGGCFGSRHEQDLQYPQLLQTHKADQNTCLCKFTLADRMSSNRREWTIDWVVPCQIVCEMHFGKASRVQVQGLPTPDEERSDFISCRVMSVLYDRKGAVTVNVLRNLFSLILCQATEQCWGGQILNCIYHAYLTFGFSRKSQDRCLTAVNNRLVGRPPQAVPQKKENKKTMTLQTPGHVPSQNMATRFAMCW